MVIPRPLTFILLACCVLAGVPPTAGARGDRGTIVINKASVDALVDVGLLSPKLKNEAWNVLRGAAVTPATADAATTTATTTTTAATASRRGGGGGVSGQRRIEVTIEEMGEETSAMAELSQLLSMSNLLYGIGMRPHRRHHHTPTTAHGPLP